MDDAQHQPDDDDSGHQPRRAGLRLRDAESVATTRRDMFGDGSLLNALAAPPPMPGHPQQNSEAPPQQPSQEMPEPVQDPSRTEAEAAAPAEAAEPTGETNPTTDGQATEQVSRVAEPDFAVNPDSFPFAQVPQSLDSIIDSFAEAPGSEPVEPSVSAEDGAVLPPRLDPAASTANAGSASFDPAATAPSAHMPSAHMAVSSVFDSIAAEPASSEAPAEEEPLPELPGLDMSMLGRPLPQVPRRRPDADPPPLPGDDADSRGHLEDTGEPIEVAANAVGGPAFVPFAPAGAAELAPPASDFDGPSFPEAAGRSFEYEPHHTSVEPESAEPPALPPFLQLPGMPPYADGSARPPFLAPLETARTPHVPEPPDDPGGPPPFLEPIVSDSVAPEPSGTEGAPRHAESEATAQPMFQAAKIAAEANATSEALDNLQRFLDRDVPGPEAAGYARVPQADRYVPGPEIDRYVPDSEIDRYVPGQEQPVRPPFRDPAPRTLLGDPAPFAFDERAPLMPLPVSPEESRGMNIYLLGFLTGLALSLMAGLALYVLINTG